jgi:hypothetical protein
MSPGIYVVGTGSVGATETFLVLGSLYLIIIVSASMLYRVPAVGWKPAGWDPGRLSQASVNKSKTSLISANHVDADQALKTPQFYLLWIMLCFNVTAGIGVLGVAKTMMTEIFGTALPTIVTSTFAATFVLMTSLFNMIGRFFWASVSDSIGRRNTYFIFFGAGALLYCLIPWIAWQVSESATWIWLAAFYAVSMLTSPNWNARSHTDPIQHNHVPDGDAARRRSPGQQRRQTRSQKAPHGILGAALLCSRANSNVVDSLESGTTTLHCCLKWDLPTCVLRFPEKPSNSPCTLLSAP